jgi:carnosine N-methyltransferase
VLEFVEAGFGCQGNEVSYFMLYGSNFILNQVEEERQFKIYPFISSTDYYYNEEDIFRSVQIPDKAACKVVS